MTISIYTPSLLTTLTCTLTLLTIVRNSLGFEHVLIFGTTERINDDVRVNDLTTLVPSWRFGQGLSTDHLVPEGEGEGRERR